MLALTADAGAFAALRGQHVGVAGVGVAPAQVCVQAAGQSGVAFVVGIAHHEGAQRPELGLDRVGLRGAGRGEAQFHLVAGGKGSDGRVLLADRLSRIT